MIKEESDYHDLESVVQQVEQNLELMTVRTGGLGGIVKCWVCRSKVDPSSAPAGPEASSEQGQSCCEGVPSRWLCLGGPTSRGHC